LISLFIFIFIIKISFISKEDKAIHEKENEKTTKQYIIVAIICIIVIGGAAAFTTYVMLDVAKDKYNTMIEDAIKPL